MFRKFIYPNIDQGATPILPALVEAEHLENLPRSLTRLGYKKTDYLVRGVAQVRSGQKVLELFGGTGLSTALIGRCTKKITTVDLHYDHPEWQYLYEQNYRLMAWHYKSKAQPLFVGADARKLPFDTTYDVVIAPDSPRTALNYTEEQRELFLDSMKEARRVLKPGGVLAATAPLSWISKLDFSDVLVVDDNHLSEALKFKSCSDPLRYVRCIV